MLRSNSKQSGESMYSVLKYKGRLRRGGFAEKKGFKSGMKESGADGIGLLIIISMNVRSIIA